jgi:hypothetical protein
MKKLSTLLSSLLLAFICMSSASASVHYYRLRVYHFKTPAQEKLIDSYLKDAYLPALHRQTSSPVGVFKTLEQDTDKRVYVLLTYDNLKKAIEADAELEKDKQYLLAAKDYLNAAYNATPYTRFEDILLKAFDKWPDTTVPQLKSPKAERIYELRSYEGPTEAFYKNKVQMFNAGGETVLFNRLKFNAVFYAGVLAGSRMPNLMYMTTFENKADRDKHWEVFSNDAEWKNLSSRPEYQHNVSKADIIFLHPAEYSDL